MSTTEDKLNIRDELQTLHSLFKNNGRDITGEVMSIKDTLATPNIATIMKRVIEEVVLEGIEPNLIGQSLLQRIEFNGPYVTEVKFRTLGAIDVGDISMAEGQEYPEFSTTNGGGQVSAIIGKYGLAVRITEEMLNNNQWDVVGYTLRELGKAMARAREENIFNVINNAGVVVFDNLNPDQSLIGRTTGRDLSGAGNGSFTADDMYDMYASTLERGFTPDVILCHPLAWATFAKDPVLREYALQGGGLNEWFSTMPNANIGQGKFIPEAWKNATRMSGDNAFNPTVNERVGTQESTFKFPSYFPGTAGLRIIASPHVRFDPVAKTTDIIMIDTKELGALCVIENPTMDEWDDPARDIKKVKIRERYGIAIFNEGQAISVARNVSIEPNEIVLPPQAIVSNIPRIQRKG